MSEKLNLLKRYFSNKYSRNDYFDLKKLVLDQDVELENLVKEHWIEFRQNEPKANKDLSNVLSLLNKKISKNTGVFELNSLFKTFSRIAAILIIPLLLAAGFLYFQFNQYLSQKDVYVQVQSPPGSRTSLNLPDGSTVWLNGNSQIRYPAVFNEKREVELTGEAFFKVKSNEAHPFLVNSSGMFIKATGTQFNVSAYEPDPEISVILKEGKIAFLNKNQTSIKEMESGHQLQYNKSTQNLKYLEVNTEDYTSWINGKLIFRNAPLAEVLRRMENWYGVNFEVQDKELLNLHFKATFIDEGIEEAIMLLQETATFKYHFSKRKVREDGSYEKSIIYISKN